MDILFYAGVLGDDCEMDVDCSAVITHTVCSTSPADVCECDPEHVTNGTHCVYAYLFDHCSLTSQCQYNVLNTVCQNSTCECEDGKLLLCLPTPLTPVCGGSPSIPLLVHLPAYYSIWPATSPLQRGLSTNPGVTVWCVCGCS